MASSTVYWNLAEHVRNELLALGAEGERTYGDLETTDDPGELAFSLTDIQKRLDKLSARIGENVDPLRKAAKALDAIPGASS